MDLTTGQTENINTEALAEPASYQAPEVRFINESDFKNFTYTGINVTIPVPLTKITSDALFAINIDGYIPNMTFASAYKYYKNLFPVQATAASSHISNMEIKHEYATLPALFNYLSHRFVAGQVGVALRITSNTAQSGNLMVSQLSGAARYYYYGTEAYTGLRFLNDSTSPIDYAPNGFALIDLSLNRHVSITAARRNNTLKTDMAKKFFEIERLGIPKSTSNFPFLTQFLEDWLIFAPQTDIPHDVASSINIAIYFDWSTVEFYTPMLPLLPELLSTDTMQILLFLKTFLNKAPIGSYSTWTWFPRDVTTALDGLTKIGNFNTKVEVGSGKLTTVVSHLVSHINNLKRAIASSVTQKPVNG